MQDACWEFLLHHIFNQNKQVWNGGPGVLDVIKFYSNIHLNLDDHKERDVKTEIKFDEFPGHDKMK